MAKADCTALVATLAVSVNDSTATTQYYVDVVEELGFEYAPLTGAAYVATTQGTKNYTLPTAAQRGLAFFYDDNQLYFADKNELAASDENWETRQGSPIVITFDHTDQRTFDIVPVPDQAGDAIGASTPFTADIGNVITVIYANNPDDVHSWEELPVALEILSREFARDSAHKDENAAKAWKGLAELFYQLVF